MPLPPVEAARIAVTLAQASNNGGALVDAARVARLDELAPTMRAWLSNPDLLATPAPLIPFFAWPERITVYSSPDKGGKSTLLSAAVAAASTGTPFLGIPIARPYRVLWACLEEHQGDLLRRLETFGANWDNVRVTAFPPNAPAAVKEVVELWRPDLVVIDTLVHYATGLITRSGDAAQWAVIMKQFMEIARKDGAAVVIAHHAQRRGGESRDSGEITAACDVVIEQKRRHSGGIARFVVRARWAVKPFGVKLEGTTYSLLDRAAGCEPALLPSLAALGRHRLTATAWCAACGGAASTFYNHRDSLVESGYVAKDGRDYFVTELGLLQLQTHSNGTPIGATQITPVTPHPRKEVGVGVTRSRAKQSKRKRHPKRKGTQ